MCTGGKSVQVRVVGAWLKLYDARSICAIEQVEGEDVEGEDVEGEEEEDEEEEGEEEEGEKEEGEEEEGEESSELDSSGDEHPAKKEERSKVVIASRA